MEKELIDNRQRHNDLRKDHERTKKQLESFNSFEVSQQEIKACIESKEGIELWVIMDKLYSTMKLMNQALQNELDQKKN